MYVDSEQCSGPFNVNTQVGGDPGSFLRCRKAFWPVSPRRRSTESSRSRGSRALPTARSSLRRSSTRPWRLFASRGGPWMMRKRSWVCAAWLPPFSINRGKAVASVGVSGPIQHMTRERISYLCQLVKETAIKISRRLGFVPGQSEGTVAELAQSAHRKLLTRRESLLESIRLPSCFATVKSPHLHSREHNKIPPALAHLSFIQERSSAFAWNPLW